MSEANAVDDDRVRAEANVVDDDRVRALIEAARKKLVDTGMRNRLVHVNRSGRGRFLNIVNERSDDVFRILRGERRKMRFHASEAAPDADESDDGVHFDEVDLGGEVDETRFTDRFLDTTLGTDALQRRLLQLARDARTAEEEQGINILFLALGFLGWFEDESSNVVRQAPLVLVPVELVRDERTSTYDIRARGEDIVTNLPLQSRLREDFGLTLPDLDPSADEWCPSAYFNLVADAATPKPRWRIERDGIQLGFFSFAKQLLQRDLDQAEWPGGGLAEDANIRSLLHAGFAGEPSPFPTGKRLDGLLAPQDIVQVIDADAPQTKVIEEVRRGGNLVVQGPPGTGKSQTITNIIAAAAHDGKTVLFMAEKMAALDVVLDRLRKCGLGDLCLELHSRHANKREILREIDRTLRSRMEASAPEVDVTELRIKRDELNRIAELLHTALKDRDYTPFAAMADVVGFIADGRTPPDLGREGLGELDAEQRRRIERDITELADLLADGPRPQHPFAGCRELDLQPVALQRLERDLTKAVGALDDALSASGAFARGGTPAAWHSTQGEAWLPRPRSVADLRRSARFLDLIGNRPQRAPQIVDAIFGKELACDLAESLDIGGQWAEARQTVAHEFRDHAWEVPAAELRSLHENLARGAAGGLKSFLVRLGGGYRRARRTLAELAATALPDSPADRVELAGQLADVQRRRRRLVDEEGILAQCLGAAWRGERTDFHGLRSAALWIAEVEATRMAGSTADLERAESTWARPAKSAKEIKERAETALVGARSVVELLRLDMDELGLGEDLDEVALSALRDRFATMAESGERYDEWRRIQKLVEKLVDAGLGELVAMLDEATLAPADAVEEFRYAAAEARWDLAKDSVPGLAGLADLNRHELVATFKDLDIEYIANVQDLIRSRHLIDLPSGAAGEMGVIRSEIAKKRRHMPIRRLMEKAGGMVQRIKPVFLMSPLSIAQFLPPSALRFDLLVVDEASQVRPEDALGAISRCGQIVIVGDQKQLPPTAFFDRLGANDPVDDEVPGDGIAAATEMESILTLCEARGVNRRMLEWHYRSRDPSLIRISNDEFYDGRLILPPSPLELDGSYGLAFERVPGVFASRGSGTGRPGTNRIEAEHVVDAVAAHAREWPGMSLGIVTFSKAQADMVTELLEYERRRNEVLDDFLREGHAEDAFVKNIENVQGDERDVIYVSVGYGPAEPGGRLNSMRFGPINAEGGERRLNVLFTRARARCRVFASFDPDDMDLARASGNGPRVLKRFLDFAKTGDALERTASGREPDSAFEEAVANVIRSLGYLADHQVGSAGFRLDLGVRHPDSPGKYLLAVECDGATYHSAVSARERDRHRQAVLEGMGWKFHRIWSTDWFHRRPQETERLARALAEARADEQVRVPGANDGTGRAVPEDPLDAGETAGDNGTLALPAIAAPPGYRKAGVSVETALEPHEVAPDCLVERVREIVAVEGPVHATLVARRIAESFGKSRVGGRIAGITEDALREARRESPSDLLEQHGFWMTREQSEQVPVRDRSTAGADVTRAAMLPPIEIVAAAALIRRECGRIERGDLIREVSRLLGFKRTGTDLRRVIGDALDAQQSRGAWSLGGR